MNVPLVERILRYPVGSPTLKLLLLEMACNADVNDGRVRVNTTELVERSGISRQTVWRWQRALVTVGILLSGNRRGVWYLNQDEMRDDAGLGALLEAAIDHDCQERRQRSAVVVEDGSTQTRTRTRKERTT